MKLYQSPTSPFVRIVRAAAEAKGLSARIELMDARADQDAFERLNPLNKVPTLVTDEGEVLVESRLICQYLDGLDGKPRLYPDEAAARRRVLQQEAVLHGMLDAAVLRRMETRRPDGAPSKWWDERQKRKLEIGFALIERELPAYTGEPTIVPITLACFLHFLDRVGQGEWRERHPRLVQWYEAYRQEPHMAATEVNG